MNNQNLSLFSRLYLSIFLVVSISIGLTLLLSEHWSQEDAQNDFLRDTKISLTQIKYLAKKTGLTIKDYIKTQQENLHFDIHWQERGNLLCIECQLLINQKELKLYQLDNGEMLAQYYLPIDSGSIVIKDRSEALIFDNDINDNSDPYDDPETWLPILIITSALLAMALGLYYPIKQLHNKVEYLNQTQKAFGQGQLNIRADINLPSPLNELARNFNLMADNIEQTLVENQVFAHAVPHELRTPLSRIQLAAGILASSEQTSENQALLNNIDTYIEDINSLIKQLLTLSKLNQTMGQTNLEPQNENRVEINIAQFIDERVSTLPLNPKVTLNCNIATEHFMTCEPSYLRLVLDNLLTNAYRYCDSQVAISMVQAGKGYQLTVEDNGKGVEEVHYQQIFIPFSRIDKSRTQATGGLGLGLAIAQAAANKLSASLTVDRSKLGGARFTLDIHI